MGEAASIRIAKIDNRFEKGGFRLSRDVDLGDGQMAALVASRARFSWKGFVLFSQHVIVQFIAKPSRQDFANLFASGFRLAKKRNRWPLLRGMQFGYMVIPVIVADEISEDLLDFVTGIPRKHWALFEFPIVCEGTTGRIHYFRKTPAWGAFYFSDLRAVAEEYLATATKESTADTPQTLRAPDAGAKPG